MRLKAPKAEPLSDHLWRLLLDGPQAVGLTLWTKPPEAELRALWDQHGPALKAARRGTRRTIWVEEYIYFLGELRWRP